MQRTLWDWALSSVARILQLDSEECRFARARFTSANTQGPRLIHTVLVQLECMCYTVSSLHDSMSNTALLGKTLSKTIALKTVTALSFLASTCSHSNMN